MLKLGKRTLYLILLHAYLIDAAGRKPQKATKLQSCFREFDKKFAHEWLSDKRVNGNVANMMYLNLLSRLGGTAAENPYAAYPGAGNYDILRYLAPQLLGRRRGSAVGLNPKQKKRQKKKRRRRKQSKKKVRKFWENAVWKGGVG